MRIGDIVKCSSHMMPLHWWPLSHLVLIDLAHSDKWRLDGS